MCPAYCFGLAKKTEIRGELTLAYIPLERVSDAALCSREPGEPGELGEP